MILMNTLTAIDDKLYALDDHDTETFDPSQTVAVDLTGQPLNVGTKVAWGTSYRGGKGAVVGEISAIDWVKESYTAHEMTADGEYVKENYEYEATDYGTKPYTKVMRSSYRYVSISRSRFAFRVTTKSLQQGRKGNSFSSSHDVVAIANQEFTAA